MTSAELEEPCPLPPTAGPASVTVRPGPITAGPGSAASAPITTGPAPITTGRAPITTGAGPITAGPRPAVPAPLRGSSGIRTPAGRAAPHLAALALVGVTAVWGSTFFLLKGVVTRMPVADFLAARFWLAAALLAALSPRAIGRLTRRDLRRGLLLGAVYGSAQLLQTTGLQHTSASVSGFVTGMYVVFTPLIAAVLLRHRIGPAVWLAVGLASAGLAVLSLHGFSLGVGESVTLASAALYAVHIVGLGAWSRPGQAYGLAVAQMIGVALVCTAGALPGGWVLPSRPADWAVLGYMAAFGAALALVVQTWAQSKLPPARAAIVMTMEPVWAGTFAVSLGGESVGLRLLVGGGLVLIAMYLAEFAPRLAPRAGRSGMDSVPPPGPAPQAGPALPVAPRRMPESGTVQRSDR